MWTSARTEFAIDVDAPSGGWAEHASGLIVPDHLIEPRRPIGIDLFAGCGGMSCGMHQGGFHVIGALELSFDAAVTYMVNLARPGVQIHFDTDARRAGFEQYLEKRMALRSGERSTGRRKKKRDRQRKRKHRKVQRVIEPMVAGSGWIRCFDQCDHADGAHDGIGFDGQYKDYLAEINQRPSHGLGCEHFWIADARTVTGKEILHTIGVARGEVDCVFGGPPCQGFSYAGRRNVVDPRNSLVFEFVRLVLEIQPKTLVFENVPGITTMTTVEGFPVVDAMCRVLEDGGFGAFDALRKSLLGEATTRRGALRGRPKPSRVLLDDVVEIADDTEPSLFDGLEDAQSAPLVVAGSPGSEHP